MPIANVTQTAGGTDPGGYSIPKSGNKMKVALATIPQTLADDFPFQILHQAVA